MFSSFNYEMLKKVFQDPGHSSILVGRILSIDPTLGREKVDYNWYRSGSWLGELKKAVEERKRTFDVTTSVMGIFNDNLLPFRFWAIVKQKWVTKDKNGARVYSDDGFLFVNFDFEVDEIVRLKDFKVYYRLWFYNYKYDDIELNIGRNEKLVSDINRYFLNGLGGIEKTLKYGMRDFLVKKIRNSGIKYEDNQY